MMVVLTFIACLVSAPDRCEDVQITMTEVSPMECIIQGQARLAGWQNEHPEYTVVRDGWKCGSTRQRKA